MHKLITLLYCLFVFNLLVCECWLTFKLDLHLNTKQIETCLDLTKQEYTFPVVQSCAHLSHTPDTKHGELYQPNTVPFI